MARAQKGILRARIRTTGRAGHSGYPEIGPSAIDRLVEALVGLRRSSWPVDPKRGLTTLNVGVIRGGVAANVIAPSAVAELVFRLVGKPDSVLGRLVTLLGHAFETEVISSHPPLDLPVSPFVLACSPRSPPPLSGSNFSCTRGRFGVINQETGKNCNKNC
jgi:acetylornithine deacetylase